VARSWGALTLTRAAITTPTWSSVGMNYFLLASRWGTWASGSSLDGRYALNSGDQLGEVAPHFLPFPQPGWSLKTSDATAYGISNRLIPAVVPVLTVSGSLPIDNASYPSSGGSGSQTYLADSRPVRILRPSFVKRSV
jgi:hypothetical protein